jgi:hypothetical protein
MISPVQQLDLAYVYVLIDLEISLSKKTITMIEDRSKDHTSF